jgi:hypothetical protein
MVLDSWNGDVLILPLLPTHSTMWVNRAFRIDAIVDDVDEAMYILIARCLS